VGTQISPAPGAMTRQHSALSSSREKMTNAGSFSDHHATVIFGSSHSNGEFIATYVRPSSSVSARQE
jgi:hypothetical protein